MWQRQTACVCCAALWISIIKKFYSLCSIFMVFLVQNLFICQKHLQSTAVVSSFLNKILRSYKGIRIFATRWVLYTIHKIHETTKLFHTASYGCKRYNFSVYITEYIRSLGFEMIKKKEFHLTMRKWMDVIHNVKRIALST